MLSQLNLLRLMTALVGFSRAWQLMTLDANLPTLIHYRPWVEALTGTFTDPQWSVYLHADSTVTAIAVLRYALLAMCLLGGVASLLPRVMLRRAWPLLILVMVPVLVINLGGTIDTGFKWAQLFEHAAQASVPVMLAMTIQRAESQRIALLGKIAIAITFIAHGLFAASYYGYPPANFISMMIIGFGLTEPQAVDALLVAGLLDFIVAVGIFWRPTERISLWYMVAWGFLTSFARLYTNYTGLAVLWPFLARWLWEFLVRTPHYGLPVWLLLRRR